MGQCIRQPSQQLGGASGFPVDSKLPQSNTDGQRFPPFSAGQEIALLARDPSLVIEVFIILTLTNIKPLYSSKSAAGTEHGTALLQQLWLWQVRQLPTFIWKGIRVISLMIWPYLYKCSLQLYLLDVLLPSSSPFFEKAAPYFLLLCHNFTLG